MEKHTKKDTDLKHPPLDPHLLHCELYLTFHISKIYAFQLPCNPFPAHSTTHTLLLTGFFPSSPPTLNPAYTHCRPIKLPGSCIFPCNECSSANMTLHPPVF